MNMYVKRTLLMRLNEVVDILKSKRGCQNYENTVDGFFTNTEMVYCAKKLRCLAARFVIKKCVLDYLASEKGYAGKNYSEIEVVNNKLGQPMLRLFSGVGECVKELKIRDILISISHSRNWITGMVVFCY